MDDTFAGLGTRKDNSGSRPSVEHCVEFETQVQEEPEEAEDGNITSSDLGDVSIDVSST